MFVGILEADAHFSEMRRKVSRGREERGIGRVYSDPTSNARREGKYGREGERVGERGVLEGELAEVRREKEVRGRREWVKPLPSDINSREGGRKGGRGRGRE
jgi:hypothetical protein